MIRYVWAESLVPNRAGSQSIITFIFCLTDPALESGHSINIIVVSLVGLGATKGVFVTTSTFSQPARDYIKHLAQRVILIDGQELANLMIEGGVGIRSYRTVAFSRLDEDFFSDE